MLVNDFFNDFNQIFQDHADFSSVVQTFNGVTHGAHLGGKCKKSVNYENIEL